MIETRTTRHSVRFFLVSGVLACGFVAGVLLLRQSDFMAAAAIFAISLAAIVGAGKLASP